MTTKDDNTQKELWQSFFSSICELGEEQSQQYASLFVHQKIAPSHLWQLDYSILKEIGIATIGDRLTIMKAITSVVENPHSELRVQKALKTESADSQGSFPIAPSVPNTSSPSICPSSVSSTNLPSPNLTNSPLPSLNNLRPSNLNLPSSFSNNNNSKNTLKSSLEISDANPFQILPPSFPDFILSEYIPPSEEEIKISQEADFQRQLITAIRGHNLKKVTDLIETQRMDFDFSTCLIDACKERSPEIVTALIERGAHVNFAKQGHLAFPLLIAAEFGHLQNVKALLAHRADMNQSTKYSETALGAASASGFFGIAKELISAQASVNIATNSGISPLLSATKTLQIDIIKLLLEKGADANAAELEEGLTPLLVAISSSRIDLVRLLLAHKANPNSSERLYGLTCLTMAAKTGSLEIVQELLHCKADATISAAGTGGTAIYAAVENGSIEICRELLQHGASANETQSSGESPLLAAVHKKNAEIVKLLLLHSADANQPSGRSATSPLYIAAQEQTYDCAIQLIESGANVNQARASDGATPVFIAAENGDEKLVRLLLEKKAKVNQSTTDEDGIAPLFIAAYKNHPSVVKTLLAHNANLNHASRDNGETALYAASVDGNLEIVQELVRCQADVNQTRLDNHSPIWVAAREGHTAVVQTLLDAKAALPKNEQVTCLDFALIKNYGSMIPLLQKAGDTKCKLAFFECLKDPFLEDHVKSMRRNVTVFRQNETHLLFDFGLIGKNAARSLVSGSFIDIFIVRNLPKKEQKNVVFLMELLIWKADTQEIQTYGIKENGTFSVQGEIGSYSSLTDMFTRSNLTSSMYVTNVAMQNIINLQKSKERVRMLLLLAHHCSTETVFSRSFLPNDIFKVILSFSGFFSFRFTKEHFLLQEK